MIPLAFAILYPEIGTILAYSGAFAGFVVIYCLPVMVYLKKRYTQITNPLLAEAIALNEFRIVTNRFTNKTHNKNDNSVITSRDTSIIANPEGQLVNSLMSSGPKFEVSEQLIERTSVSIPESPVPLFTLDPKDGSIVPLP